MASKRIDMFFLIIAITFAIVNCKVFTRCQLTRELLRNNFPRTFISNSRILEFVPDVVINSPPITLWDGQTHGEMWVALVVTGVCMIEQESDRNTATLVTKTPRRKYYGLFQIGSEYCKEGRKGGKCDISCEALLDDDIKGDSLCALKVFEQEGFKYWSKWETRCKGQTLPDIEKCPEWLNL